MRCFSSSPSLRLSSRQAGFTLIELAVVILLIALLVSLSLPALAKGSSKSQTLQCLNRARQLIAAWGLYLADHQDKVPPAMQNNPKNQWVGGYMDFVGGNRSNWDPNQDLKQGLLWPYCNNDATLFKCTADLSTVRVGSVFYPRVRSIAMNAWFDSIDVAVFSPGYRVYKNWDDLIEPGPALTWVFGEERADSINDAELIVGMDGYPNRPAYWRIVDYPASYHDGAAVFSFADGHAEIKKWLDMRTIPVLKKGQLLPLNVSSPYNPDVLWLMDRSTRRLSL